MAGADAQVTVICRYAVLPTVRSRPEWNPWEWVGLLWGKFLLACPWVSCNEGVGWEKRNIEKAWE
jgi:hypothetical protein